MRGHGAGSGQSIASHTHPGIGGTVCALAAGGANCEAMTMAANARASRVRRRIGGDSFRVIAAAKDTSIVAWFGIGG